MELRALAAAPQDVDLAAKHSVIEHQLASDRTTSTATPAISLGCLRGAHCDHNRSMGAGTQVRIRETPGTRIRYLEHEHGSRSSHLRSPAPARFLLGYAW